MISVERGEVEWCMSTNNQNESKEEVIVHSDWLGTAQLMLESLPQPLTILGYMVVYAVVGAFFLAAVILPFQKLLDTGNPLWMCLWSIPWGAYRGMDYYLSMHFFIDGDGDAGDDEGDDFL